MTAKELQVSVQVTWDDASRGLIETVWTGIMRVAQAVVKSHDELGFELISTKLNPSLEDILLALHSVGRMIDALMPSMEEDMSLYRQALNAKQQICRIEMASFAVNVGERDNYMRAIEDLRKQADF